MSKSDSSEMTRIELLDNNDLIAKKISKAKTDPLPMPEQVSDLESRPEVSNLINIYSAFSKEEVVAVINKFEGKPLSEFKKELGDIVVNQIEPIREEFIKLKKERKYITNILDKGRIKAKEKSDPILNQIKSIVGLG
jgi:tryptophanyl-tRNA synthetase